MKACRAFLCLLSVSIFTTYGMEQDPKKAPSSPRAQAARLTLVDEEDPDLVLVSYLAAKLNGETGAWWRQRNISDGYSCKTKEQEEDLRVIEKEASANANSNEN